MNIPEGFVLVPVEPTEEMLNAGIEHEWTKEVYVAMVNAAPTDYLSVYDEAKERELFEAYASTHYRMQELPLEFDDGEYIEPETQYSWESWEACAKSRARSAE